MIAEAAPAHQGFLIEQLGADLWGQLHWRTRESLVTAEYLNYLTVRTDLRQFGPVAIPYFSALENEVVVKVQQGWGKLLFQGTHSPLRHFIAVLETAAKGTFGGSTAKILAEKAAAPELLLAALPGLRSLYSSHRNPSAHIGDFPRTRVEELRHVLFAGGLCRTFLAGIQPREGTKAH